MGFGKHTDPMVGKRFPEQDPTKGGRPVSIKKQLKEILQSNGEMTFEASEVISINEDGSVTIKVPTQMKIAMKITAWAESKKGGDSLKAIEMIMKQFDSETKKVQHEFNGISGVIFNINDDDEHH